MAQMLREMQMQIRGTYLMFMHVHNVLCKLVEEDADAGEEYAGCVCACVTVIVDF